MQCTVRVCSTKISWRSGFSPWEEEEMLLNLRERHRGLHNQNRESSGTKAHPFCRTQPVWRSKVTDRQLRPESRPETRRQRQVKKQGLQTPLSRISSGPAQMDSATLTDGQTDRRMEVLSNTVDVCPLWYCTLWVLLFFLGFCCRIFWSVNLLHIYSGAFTHLYFCAIYYLKGGTWESRIIREFLKKEKLCE